MKLSPLRSFLRSCPRPFNTINDWSRDDLRDLRSTARMRELLQEFYNKMRDKGSDPDKFDKSQLEKRRMAESRSQFVIPLQSDPDVRHKYLSHSGAVRFGKLLEDLDYFAVWVAYKHNHGGSEEAMASGESVKRSVVTACVDRIDLQRLILSADRDFVLDGFVSWTGKSSMETSIRLLQEDANGNLSHVLRAKFVMVSMDPTKNGKTVPVHPLIYPTIEEGIVFQEGMAAGQARKNRDKQSLFIKKPCEEEIELMHSLFVDSLGAYPYSQRELRSGEVFLDDTAMQTVRICFPEHRNIYGKIFGGFLMREAFELASATTKTFCGRPTEVFAVDDIAFVRAVEIGDMVVFDSRVTYTNDNCMQVRVEAQVRNYGKRITTNTFHFSFRTQDGSAVPVVVPATYSRGMMYLNGRRHMLKAFTFDQH